MGNYNCLTSRSLCLLVLVWPALHTVSSFLLADDTPLSSGTAVVADRDKRDARTVLKLHAYKDLFNDWSVVLTSGSNIYLLRFTGKLNSTIGYNAIASNVSIKPFYDAAFEASNSLNRAYKHGTDEYGTNKFMVDTNQTGTNRADTNGADTTHHADTGETANDHPADDTVEAITDQPRDTLQPEKDDGSWSEPDTLQFIRTQYHRSSNKLILLDNSTGQLITFDTVTLRTKHLALSDRVIDFSVNENSDTLYYLTRRMNILTVHRVGLVMDESRDLSVDESTIYLILRLAATNSWRSRLTIDYLRKSLYLFLMINNRFFSYEMRLVDKTASNYRALSKLCRRRSYCAGKLLYSSGPNEARMLRPWHDSGDSLFVTDPKECKSLNFLVSRDRILDIEVRCPAYSLSIYRVEAARRGNWERDVRRSNFTVHRQSDQYLFSAILDTDDERDIRETIPLRIVVVRSTGRSGNNSAINGSAKRIYAERVSYATECEIEKQQAPSVDRISQASRLPLALIDKVWNDLTDVDSMYIRTKNLFESMPELRLFMHKRRTRTPTNNIVPPVETPRDASSHTTATTTFVRSVVTPRTDRRIEAQQASGKSFSTDRWPNSAMDKLATITNNDPPTDEFTTKEFIGDELTGYGGDIRNFVIVSQKQMINAMYVIIFSLIICLLILAVAFVVYAYFVQRQRQRRQRRQSFRRPCSNTYVVYESPEVDL